MKTFFINMIYIQPDLKYLRSSSSYLTNLELNWTNEQLNADDKDKGALVCLFAQEDFTWSVCCSWVRRFWFWCCLSKSQCFWASRWLTCTRGGGGHLGSLSAGNFPNAVEPNETTYMKAICKTYSMRQLLTSICWVSQSHQAFLKYGNHLAIYLPVFSTMKICK